MTDIRQDIAFFGRTDELGQLIHNLQRGIHTIIVAKQGMGKTRLMQEARWVLSGRKKHIEFSPLMIARRRGRLAMPVNTEQYKFLRIENSTPHADCMKELCEKLFYNGDLHIDTDEERSDWVSVKKRLAHWGKPKLQGIIFEAIARSKPPYLLFFDNLDRVTAAQAPFLESLINCAIICAAVVQTKDHPSLNRIWSSFSRIELEPLPLHTSKQLVDHCIDRYHLRIIDRKFYRAEILKASNGSPREIKNMLWHGSRERFVDLEEIRKLRRIDVADYFNMGPLYILVVALFTMFKIFSIGTDNREFYIYFSALGFIAYLIFRVFRGFFIFRPQKHP